MRTRNVILGTVALLGLCICGLCVAGLATFYVFSSEISAILTTVPTVAAVPTLLVSTPPPIALATSTSTPVRTATSAATPTPLATLGLRTPPPVSGTTAPTSAARTPTPARTATGGTSVVFSDSFSGTCNLKEGDDENRSLKCENGEYVVLLKKKGSRWLYYTEDYGDFVLEVDARAVSGPPGFEYGLVFRIADDGQELYGFTLTRDGKYSVFLYQNDQYSDLMKYTSSSAIKTGTNVNRLRVVAQGEVLALYVNDTWLTSVRDATLDSGYFGVYVNTNDPDAKVAFDNVRLSKINQPIAVPTPK